MFRRGGTPEHPVQGWIYLSLGKGGPWKYTAYVYDNGKEAGTVFGAYDGAMKTPDAFPDGGDNYFWEMSDSQGLWLWLYRLYGPVS